METGSFTMSHFFKPYFTLRNLEYVSHFIMKSCLVIVTAIMFTGCTPSQIQPQEVMTSPPGKDTSGSSPETKRFSSAAMGISFDFPEGWVTEETEQTIYLAQSDAHMPWGADFFLTPVPEPYFEIYVAPAYLNSVEQAQNNTRTALELAGEIAYSFKVGSVNGTLVEDVRSEVINGAEAAILLIDTGNIYSYIIVVKISEDKATVINGIGAPASKTKLIDVVNLIAYTLHNYQE